MVSSVASFAQHSIGSVSIQPKVGGTLTTFAGKDSKGANMKLGLYICFVCANKSEVC